MRTDLLHSSNLDIIQPFVNGRFRIVSPEAIQALIRGGWRGGVAYTSVIPANEAPRYCRVLRTYWVVGGGRVDDRQTVTARLGYYWRAEVLRVLVPPEGPWGVKGWPGTGTLAPIGDTPSTSDRVGLSSTLSFLEANVYSLYKMWIRLKNVLFIRDVDHEVFFKLANKADEWERSVCKGFSIYS